MKLVGTCNQCGLCCMEGDSKCYHLEVSPLGGTRCLVYNMRYNGMPIILHKGNVVTGIAACAKDSEAEDMEIIKKGIGKGCSLKVVEG